MSEIRTATQLSFVAHICSSMYKSFPTLHLRGEEGGGDGGGGGEEAEGGGGGGEEEGEEEE